MTKTIAIPALNRAENGWLLSFNVPNYGGRAVYKVDDTFLADLDEQLAKWRRLLVIEVKTNDGLEW